MTGRPGLIHLHCGDVAAGIHRRSGLPVDFRVWRDSPAVGPWSANPKDLGTLRAIWWGVPLPDMQDLPQLQDLARATEAVLWFGPDPWEQACLLWVLAELPDGTLPDLVPLDHAVGHMSPAALPRCFAERRLLEEAELHEARALWNIFLTQGWGALGGARMAALPHLGPALARLAEDHPPTGPGRTARQVRLLLDEGVKDMPALLRGMAQLEDGRHGAWCGDLYLARVAEAMGVRLA
jgi:hypothetical protein